MATIYRWWAAIVVVAVVVQVGFAGYGSFYAAKRAEDDVLNSDKFTDGFGLHSGFGYIVVLAGLLLLIFAALSRGGRRRILHAAGLFGLLIVQVLLAWFGSAVPVIGFFHPINALLIFAFSSSIAYTAWRGSKAPAPAVT
jgi:heme A synthase